MRTRWGLGPVFVYEWLTASRRWQMYALRALFVALLFLAVVIVWYNEAEPSLRGATVADRNAHARAGVALFYGFFGTLLSVVLLLAPGATAGAVCLDKARGTLLHLLVTDLSSAEIVLGKLAVRLIPLFGLVLASVPVLSLCLWLGGIDPEAMLVAYSVIAGVAVLGSAVAFLLSVWGRKTHEVLLAAYLFEILLLLAYPIAIGVDSIWRQTWLSPYFAWTNPYRLAFSPYMFRGATDPAELTGFLGFCFGAGAVAALLAVATVRPVTVRQSNAPPRRRWRWLERRRRVWFRPRLDRNPVYWRECHRQRPSRWVRIVWCVYVAGAVAGTVTVMAYRADKGPAAIISAFQVSIGLLLASVAAVTSLSEERVRGSLDVLLTTPLKTKAIVWGKWRGAFRLVLWLAVLPAVNVAVAATPGNQSSWVAPGSRPPPPPAHPELIWLCVPVMVGLVLAYGAAVTSFGLLCATVFRRLGRAIGASVAVYALVTVGWVALVATVGRHGRDNEHLMVVSPFYGPGELAAESSMTWNRTAAGLPDSLPAILTCIGGYAAAAGLLYVAVLATFNRCLGRMSERPFTRRYPPSLFRARRQGAKRKQNDESFSLSLPRLPEDVVAPIVVDVPGQDEQQVGQPIQVDERPGADGLGPHQRDDRPLGPAADGPGQVAPRGGH
jgi:ABC-type transport system involved in multi-copper enzyme maturation permease subunit